MIDIYKKKVNFSFAFYQISFMASYPSGLRDRFAKPPFAGSNPADASSICARVMELVDMTDLKSVG